MERSTISTKKNAETIEETFGHEADEVECSDSFEHNRLKIDFLSLAPGHLLYELKHALLGLVKELGHNGFDALFLLELKFEREPISRINCEWIFKQHGVRSGLLKGIEEAIDLTL